MESFFESFWSTFTVPLKYFIMLYYRLSSWINIVHICSNYTCIRNLILTMCVYCWSVRYMWHLLHVCELRTPSGLEAVLSPIQWEKQEQKNYTFQSNNWFSSLFHCFFVFGIYLQGSWWMCLSVGRTPPLAQSAAAGRSAGIHFKSSVQRQPEDSSAWRVGLLHFLIISCSL